MWEIALYIYINSNIYIFINLCYKKEKIKLHEKHIFCMIYTIYYCTIPFLYYWQIMTFLKRKKKIFFCIKERKMYGL